MKACPHCGADMADVAPRCPTCGVRKGAQSQESLTETDRSIGEPVGVLAALLFSVLVLAAAVTYLYF